MPERQDTLVRFLVDAGHDVTKGRLARPSLSCRSTGGAGLWGELEAVYRKLGGVLDTCPVQVGSWDVEVDGIALELDEEQHFNRYRALTLESRVYAQLPNFPVEDYGRFSRLYERECLRKASNRGYWASDSTVKQFGQAGSLGQLTGGGSPRWKQRAFYDYLKDVAPFLTGTRVGRVSIFDEVEFDGRRLKVRDVLDRYLKQGTPAILALAQSRAEVA